MMLMRKVLSKRFRKRSSPQSDRDSAFALLIHPVHYRSPFVHLADLVRHAGVEKDALGAGSLPRIDMRHDPDIADLIELYLACHLKLDSRYQR